jgi:hypothetical protein
MRNTSRIGLALMLLAIGLSAGQGTATLAGDLDTATLLRRISQLEERAGKVDQLTGRVEELEGHLSHLQGKLEQYETQPQDAEVRQAFIQQEIERLFAEAEQSSSSGNGEGVELGFWVWLTYLHDTGKDMTTFWAWEVELSASKTFSSRLATTVELQFIDTNRGIFSEIEQAFLSIVLHEKTETLLTVGKFNAPFGTEQRDFWDRLTGTVSLLFYAQPQDLTGIMLTQPVGDTGITLKPFLVNGDL